MRPAFVLCLLCPLQVGLSGCHPPVKDPWWTIKEIERASPRTYPDADAVYLRVDRAQTFNLSPDLPFNHVRHGYHHALRVLTEKGLEQANFRVPFPADAELIDLSARVLRQGMEVEMLEPQRVHREQGRLGDSALEWRVFSLPRVRVGDVIEVKYAADVPQIQSWDLGLLGGEIPVLESQVRFRFRGGSVVHSLEAYNTRPQEKWQISRDGDDEVAVLRVRDVPGYRREPLSPHPRRVIPYWAFSMRRAFFGVYGVDVLANWTAVVREPFKTLTSEASNGAAHLTLPSRLTRAVSPAQRIDRALAWVRDELGQTRAETADPTIRPFARIVAEKTPTALERAALLQHVLQRGEVESVVALIRPAADGPLDTGVVLPRQFTDALVRVTVPGERHPLWLAPSCRDCQTGEVPRDMIGQPALLLSVDSESRPVVPSVRFEVVVAAYPRPCTLRTETELEVQGGGEVSGRTMLVGGGVCRQGGPWRARPDEQRRRLQRMLEPMVPGIHLGQIFTQPPREPGGARAITVRWRASRLAVAVQGKLLVPLVMLRSPLSSVVKAQTRLTPLSIDTVRRYLQRVTVIAPRGHHVVCGGQELGSEAAGDFGSLRTGLSAVDETRCTFESEMSLWAATHAPSRYGEFREFIASAEPITKHLVTVITAGAVP